MAGEALYDSATATVRRAPGAGVNGPWTAAVELEPDRTNGLWAQSSPGTATVYSDAGCLDGAPRHVTGSLRPYLER